MKKAIGMAVGILFVLTMAGCGSNSGKIEPTDSGSVQIPNPFISCETIDKAAQLAGFEVALPQTLPEGYTQNTILAIEKQMIEVNYINDDEQEMYIRKATGKDDISGDYNEYQQQSTTTVDGREVTLKGNDDLVNVAIWQNGDYSFAIGVNNGGAGIDNNSMCEMIQDIN